MINTYELRDNEGALLNTILATPDDIAGFIPDGGEAVFIKGPDVDEIRRKLHDKVNSERDRRLAADFEFQGKMYQRDQVSITRISGAATLAGFAVGAGAQPGDLRWANPDRDFGWIAMDNTITPMDAHTAFAFGQAAANVETDLIFAAKSVREMDPIPDNFTDDVWWT
ncbi:MAG: hypothetical protein II336_15235 [Loktanella sp.]|nr:hypothetical protein [Loktanella sp.]